MIELQKHIEILHPIKQVVDPLTNETKTVSFGIFEDVGTLPLLERWKKDTTPLAQQIGIGPTLFLLTTRTLGYFFLFLTLVNLPILHLYQGTNPGGAKSEVYNNIWARYSMGNIGSNAYACDTVDIRSIFD